MIGAALTGGCACGAIRFAARGKPRFAFFCQCRDCQKMTGSGHATQFCHDAEGFEVTGSPAGWSRSSASGSQVTKMFCPTCGTPIYGTTSRAPAIVMVMAGALDDPGAIAPDRIFFQDEAQSWDRVCVPETLDQKD